MNKILRRFSSGSVEGHVSEAGLYSGSVGGDGLFI